MSFPVSDKFIMKKKCSIIFYEGWVDVAPTVINLAKSLFDRDYTVSIFCRQSQFNIPGNDNFLAGFVSVIYFKNPFLLRMLIRFFRKLKLGPLFTFVTFIDMILFFVQIRVYKLKQSLKSEYELIIGIDTNGSVVSLLESLFVQTRDLVYLSLELSRTSNFRHFDVRYFLEKLSYKNAKCLIIQDSDRFEYIKKYMGYDQENVFYIPNSESFDLKSKIFLDSSESNYFRQILNLTYREYPLILLHAGTICDPVFSKELACSFNSISIDCALIFHERQKRDINDPYLKSLGKINSKNLFLSLNPVPYNLIYKVFKSTDIGIVCYKDIDENFSLIAKASGKMALYLKYGKPVLMNDLQSLRNLNEKYKIGMIIKDISNPTEIEFAIKEIRNNYEYFSENALACFHAEFDFTVKVNPFLEFLEASSKSKALA